MADEHKLAAAERVIKLEEELEASGVAAHDDETMKLARARLHEWVDSIAVTIVSPALGRVTLIHADGGQSTIISPTLPFTMSKPAGQ